MWPDPVERIAAELRQAGIEGRLEELPSGVDSAPDGALRAEGFECDGRPIVALVPVERALDREKLAAAARCRELHPAGVSGFPFRRTRVFLDSSVLTAEIAWIEAGSPRHVLGLPPGQLNSLVQAQSADLLQED